MPARVPVTAVLVAHDGGRWLPAALSALATSTVTPARLLAVDTGSSDDSAALLRRATGSVLELPRSTGYAAAVAAALASVPADTRWVWLLHDDCAPDPGTLSALLRAAAASSSAAVLGPKVVDWDDPRMLVEIGCTTDLLGVRETFVEPGEPDQGQYDQQRPVLAVGTAGALIRRDVWDELGGLEVGLPLREDLDLGWRAWAAGHEVLVVPAARLRHARAVTTGRRDLHSEQRDVAAVDRRSAVQLLLAHAAGWRLPLVLSGLLVAGVLRALGHLLVRRPGEAAGELFALAVPPRRLLADRRARRATRIATPSVVRPHLGSTWARLRTRLSGLLERAGPRAVPALEESAAPRTGLWSRLRQRPALLLTGALLVVTLLAARALLDRGALSGGRLLPAPDGAGALWSAYATTAEPALAVLALLATVLLGSAGLAVDLLLLGAVPLAGLVAFLVTTRVVGSRLLQLWAGATWALLPVATGAVAAGRLGGAAVHVTLPALLLLGHRVATGDPRTTGWSRAWALGLALTPVVALAPVLWPLALLLLVGSGLLRVTACSPAQRPAARRRALACGIAAVVPVLLLLPWSPSLFGARSLLHGPGRVGPGLAGHDLPFRELLLLHPGGPGLPALLLTLPLVLAALGGLLRTRRARTAAAGWGLAVLGLAAALLLARLRMDGLPVWPGVPLDLAAAGMLLAALVGAEGLQGSLSRSTFGWRQLSAVLLVLAAAAVPLAAAADWVRRGADGPLQRVEPQPLPAFVAAELSAASGRRALLLDQRPDGSVGYAVVDGDGARLGDAPVELDDVVTELLSPRGAPAAGQAAEAGVAFVASAPGPVADALDEQPGLDREPGGPPLLWRVVPAPRPAPEPADELGAPALAAQGLAVLVVAVLAGPGAPPRRGLVREPRR